MASRASEQQQQQQRSSLLSSISSSASKSLKKTKPAPKDGSEGRTQARGGSAAADLLGGMLMCRRACIKGAPAGFFKKGPCIPFFLAIIVTRSWSDAVTLAVGTKTTTTTGPRRQKTVGCPALCQDPASKRSMEPTSKRLMVTVVHGSRTFPTAMIRIAIQWLSVDPRSMICCCST